jgi:hypothetical protein
MDGYAPATYDYGSDKQPSNPGGPVMHELAYDPTYYHGGGAPSTSPSSPRAVDSPNTEVPIVTAQAAHEARQVDLVKWLRGGWSMYLENWKYFSGFQVLIFFLNFLLPLTYFIMMAPGGDFHTMDKGGDASQMGHPLSTLSDPADTFAPSEYREPPMDAAQHLSLLSLLTWPLYMGHFFVGLSILRAKVYGVGYNTLDDDEERHHHHSINDGETDEAKVRFHEFLSGYYLYFPLLALSFVHGLLVLLGLVCLILPGLYLMVVLAFVEILYIEYHHAYSTFDRYASEPQPFSFWQAFTVSVERVHPHFLRVTGFLLILVAIYYVGELSIVGTIITVPLTSLCIVVAFEDLFGLRQEKVKEHACFFSC